MSVKGVNNLEDKLNRLKMILFMDEGVIWKMFSDRMDNDFVRSAKDSLKSKGTVSSKVTDKIFDPVKTALTLTSIHDDAINFQNVKEGHIEYRYLGGDNYEKKESQLTTTIGHFAHNMAIGYDPEFKKKEYEHKLSRIFNKMDLFKYEKWLYYILDRKKDAFKTMTNKDKSHVLKKQKEYEKNRNMLSKLYKIDGKTNKLLNKNDKYLQSIWDEYKKDFRQGLSQTAAGLMRVGVRRKMLK
jgi:hypothetical protein